MYQLILAAQQLYVVRVASFHFTDEGTHAQDHVERKWRAHHLYVDPFHQKLALSTTTLLCFLKCACSECALPTGCGRTWVFPLPCPVSGQIGEVSFVTRRKMGETRVLTAPEEQD